MSEDNLRSISSFIEELHQRVRRDSLCPLDNQQAFYEDARESHIPQNLIFVAMMDVNNFKQFNSRGQDFGDSVLASIGERIASVCGFMHAKGYRIGGDEFVVVMTHSSLRGLSKAANIEDLQLDAVVEFFSHSLSVIGGDSYPVTFRGERVRPSLSVGLAIALGTDTTCKDILDRANVALSFAKLEGKRQGHSFRVYDDSMSSGPKKGAELRQTCTHCGSTVHIIVHPEWTNTRPPEPLCPICTEPLKELELQTQNVTRPLDIVGPLFPDAPPSSPSNHLSP